MALDLPALERPQNATSAPLSAGHSDSLEALVKKLAEWKFIAIGELFGSCRPTEGNLLYNAGQQNSFFCGGKKLHRDTPGQ